MVVGWAGGDGRGKGRGLMIREERREGEVVRDGG